MPQTWQEIVDATALTGEYITPPIVLTLPANKVSTDIVRSFRLNHKCISALPTGVSIKAYFRESANSGQTWGAWLPAYSGTGAKLPANSSVAHDYETTITATYATYRLQLKYVFDTDDLLEIPAVQLQNQTCWTANTAVWTSPVIDWSGYAITSAILTATTGRASGGAYDSIANRDTAYTAVIQVRSGYDSDELGEWITCTSGEQIPAVGGFIQFRCAYLGNSAFTRVGVYYDDLIITATRAGGLQGVWTSPAIDVSSANDLSSGTLVADITEGAGTLYAIQTRSRTSSSGAWSDWVDLGAADTCQHPPDNEVQMRIQFSGVDTKVNSLDLQFDGTPQAIPLLTGVSASALYDFAVLNNILVVVNGIMRPQKWTGAPNAVEVLGGSPPVFSCLEVHNNSLWGVERGTSRLRKSAVLNPESWAVLDFFDFNPDDGDQITAIMRVGSNLLVSKQRSMAMLMGNTSATYNIKWLEAPYGVTGFKALCSAGAYVCYVSNHGVILTDFIDYPVISEKVQDAWDGLNKYRLANAKLHYWNDCVYCLFASEGSTINDQLWIYDTRYNSWDIQTGYNISDMISYNVAGEEKLLALDSVEGQVYTMDEGVLNPDGTRASYVWQTKTFDMGYPERYKLFKGIYLDIEGIDIASTLDMYFIVDDVELATPYTTEIPAGQGDSHSRWILPPLFDAVLGTHLALRFEGSVGIKGISIEYITRGVTPEGLL